jgi:hypothetical protein
MDRKGHAERIERLPRIRGDPGRAFVFGRLACQVAGGGSGAFSGGTRGVAVPERNMNTGSAQVGGGKDEG